jgi:hypothetical protein
VVALSLFFLYWVWLWGSGSETIRWMQASEVGKKLTTLWQGLEVKELGPDSVPLNIDGGFGAGFFFRRV